jgi:hypothetical protein
MPADLFDFTWEAPERGDGYRWRPFEGTLAVIEDLEEGASGTGLRWLGPTLALQRNEGVPFHAYRPLAEHPALFRDFADTRTTPEAILAFANRHGRLRGQILVLGGSNEITLGETLFDWRQGILSMRGMVALWDAIQKGNVKELSGRVKVTGDAIRGCFTRPAIGGSSPDADRVEGIEEERWRTVWSRKKNPEVFTLLTRNDLRRAARLVLQHEVNAVLPMLVSSRFVWDADRGQSSLRIVPISLFGAMCLQLAQAIDGDRRYQACPVCHRWFELTPGVNRADRLMCSDTCRTKAYRLRKEKARQRHAEGRSARQIAIELESNVETVKGWIEGERSKSKAKATERK